METTRAAGQSKPEVTAKRKRAKGKAGKEKEIWGPGEFLRTWVEGLNYEQLLVVAIHNAVFRAHARAEEVAQALGSKSEEAVFYMARDPKGFSKLSPENQILTAFVAGIHAAGDR